MEMMMDGSEKLAVAAKAGAKKADFMSNGEITVEDCPFPPGTGEAKKWFADNVDANLKNGITPEMKAKYGDKVVGAFNGRPLVPGERGLDQGDAEYMMVKLQVTEGVSKLGAAKVLDKATRP